MVLCFAQQSRRHEDKVSAQTSGSVDTRRSDIDIGTFLIQQLTDESTHVSALTQTTGDAVKSNFLFLHKVDVTDLSSLQVLL